MLIWLVELKAIAQSKFSPTFGKHFFETISSLYETSRDKSMSPTHVHPSKFY